VVRHFVCDGGSGARRGLRPGAGQLCQAARGAQSFSLSPGFAREKAPSLVDPAGPTISLVSSEPVFLMAAALNACGYDEGLEESDPVRQRVRAEMNQALAKSDEARNRRDHSASTLPSTA